MQRRKFLKFVGLGALIVSVPSCMSRTEETKKVSARSKNGKMSVRNTPATGDTVSLLGYGCMRLPIVPGADETDAVIDQQQVQEHVDYALKHGVNYFDTAPVYCQGKSEGAIGQALSRHPRNSYFVATKMSNFKPETWPREQSIAIFQNSLRELRTDYIDYYLLHAIGGTGADLDAMATYRARFEDNGILDYLLEQRRKGTIRNLGFSYHGDIKVFDHLLHLHDSGRLKWDFVQIQHNYIDYKHAPEVNPSNTASEYLYSELDKRGIPAVVMEPLLGGRLANVPPQVEAKMRAVKPDSSPAEWAFRYAATQPRVLTVLSGMTLMEHLQENINTFSPLEPISNEEDEFLQSLALEIMHNNQIPCTHCEYCMPCPYGIDIPGIFAHYNKCINHDNVPRDKQSSRYAEARRAFLIGYDRQVPRLRQAEHCIECGRCAPQCPQDINIPQEMRKIDKYVKNLRANKV